MKSGKFLFGWVAITAVILTIGCITSAAAGEKTAVGKETKRYAIVVSKATQADNGWAEVVESLAQKYKNKYRVKVFSYDYPDIGSLTKGLNAFMPWYICVVAQPAEASRDFIQQTAETLRWLDDDPYEDAVWAILTGFSAEDGLRIARAKDMVITKGLSGVGSGWLDWFESGLTFSEGEKNAKFVKEPGKPTIRQIGPDDTTKNFVEALNSNKYQVMSTSGHATENDWQIGYSYRNGQIVSNKGRLFGIDTTRKVYEIITDNPKIYYSPGNCLIAHISNSDCMALAWIHNGVNQFFGHIYSQGQPCYAWAIADYFFSLQGRFTYAESVYVHWLALQYESSELGKVFPCCLPDGKKGTVLYGDPAWEARMKRTVNPLYEQNLTITPTPNSNKYRINLKITLNQDASVARHPVALLPFPIQNPVVKNTNAKKVIVADNFILMHVQNENEPPLKKGEERSVEIIAELCQRWVFKKDIAQEH